jgi:hypothetical protein
MRLPRVRFTVRRMMILVAVASVMIFLLVEVFLRSPERQQVRRLIAHHEIRAGSWNFIADSSERESERQKECRRLVKWHEDRLKELRDGGLPENRFWWEDGDRMSRYEQELFGQFGGTGMVPIDYKAL